MQAHFFVTVKEARDVIGVGKTQDYEPLNTGALTAIEVEQWTRATTDELPRFIGGGLWFAETRPRKAGHSNTAMTKAAVARASNSSPAVIPSCPFNGQEV